ncbi:hypothetical protein [Amycolatopsis sp. 195334CR]|nr:hypothetical protein [Amycolatopsis sp. 195334CR]MBN6037478.1 hypothetical protein [Amycolatopsis sp. 195334CR]
MDYWAEQDEKTLNTAWALLKEQEGHAEKPAARGKRAPGAGGPQYSG